MTPLIPRFAIIAGSMKCGTTILYDYLCSNPSVLGYPGKEAHYFSLRYKSTLFSDYISEFGTTEDRILCDASPTYFDCSDREPTLERIKSHVPNAIIIVLIRNPVERALSHFQHLQRVNKINSLQDISANDFFGSFLSPRESPFFEYLNDVLSFSFYHKKLSRLLEVFDPGHVVIIDNSYLSMFPVNVMRLIYSRLGTDFYESPIYGHRNYMSGTDLSCMDADLQRALTSYFESDYRMSLELCTEPR